MTFYIHNTTYNTQIMLDKPEAQFAVAIAEDINNLMCGAVRLFVTDPTGNIIWSNER